MNRVNRNQIKGFTLVELMVALAIMAILVMAAAPNFSAAVKRNRIESQLKDLSGHVKLARSEAISRSRTVTICRSSDQATCSTAAPVGDWSIGWITFLDLNGNATVDGDDIVLRVHGGLEQNILTVTDSNPIPGNVGDIQFTRNGVDSRVTFEMCEDGGENKMARALIMELTGRLMWSTDSDSNDVFEDILGNDLSC
ncbi:MAG: GspH/FimT family pseudopilin [Oceanicoccus sp.]